jgi:hypothetical protein
MRLCLDQLNTQLEKMCIDLAVSVNIKIKVAVGQKERTWGLESVNAVSNRIAVSCILCHLLKKMLMLKAQ